MDASSRSPELGSTRQYPPTGAKRKGNMTIVIYAVQIDGQRDTLTTIGLRDVHGRHLFDHQWYGRSQRPTVYDRAGRNAPH